MTEQPRGVLVTGAAGNLGRALVRDLLDEGKPVYALCRHAAAAPPALDGAHVIEGDIANPRAMAALAELPVDQIYHLAARADVPQSVSDPVGDFEVNARGVVNVLEAARRMALQSFVLLSSVSVLDPSNSLPLGERDFTGPSSPYAAAKLAAEGYCSAYFRSYRVPTRVVRLTNAYGPGITRFSVWDLTNKLLANPITLEMLGNGEQVRDFIYIADAVRAIRCVGERGADGEIYHAASGAPTTLRKLALGLAACCGCPDVEIVPTGRSWQGDVARWYADIGKLRALGFTPRVSLAEGLQLTVRWIQAQHEPAGRPMRKS